MYRTRVLSDGYVQLTCKASIFEGHLVVYYMSHIYAYNTMFSRVMVTYNKLTKKLRLSEV